MPVSISPILDDAEASTPLRGWIEHFDEDGVGGWCVNVDDPEASLVIEVRFCDWPLCRTATSLVREDIGALVPGSARAGFWCSWKSLSIKDFDLKRIRETVDRQPSGEARIAITVSDEHGNIGALHVEPSCRLTNSQFLSLIAVYQRSVDSIPQGLTGENCANAEKIKGFCGRVERIDEDLCKGWCLQLGNPDSVAIQVSMLGFSLGEMKTNLPRSDIEKRLGPCGSPGFRFSWSQLRPDPGVLERIHNAAGEVPDSPADLVLAVLDGGEVVGKLETPRVKLTNADLLLILKSRTLEAGGRSGDDIAPVECVRESIHKSLGKLAIVFDSEYYTKTVAECGAGRLGAFEHYCAIGMFRDDDPCALFSSKHYLSQKRVPRGVPAITHYLSHPESLASPHILFDAAQYRKAAGDGGSERTALEDYVGRGWDGEHSPHVFFDQRRYIESYGSGKVLGRTPLEDYLRSAPADGRSPHPLFDGAWYLDRNPDVAKAGMNPLVHFVLAGGKELRDPHPLVSLPWLTEGSNEPNGLQAFRDFITRAEAGRDPHPLVDLAFLTENCGLNGEKPADVLSAYLQESRYWDKAPNKAFDPCWYLEDQRSARNAQLAPLCHYVKYGAARGAFPSPLFWPEWYARTVQNPEAKRSALAHFVRVGKAEGRPPNPLATRETEGRFRSGSLVEIAEQNIRRLFDLPARLPVRRTADGFLSLPWKGTKPRRSQAKSEKVILLVGHEASRTGAPRCLLELARNLVVHQRNVWLVLVKGGDLGEAFETICPTLNLNTFDPSGDQRDKIEYVLRLFKAFNPQGVVVVNTASLEPVYSACETLAVNTIAWVHEMPGFVGPAEGARRAELLRRTCRTIVTVAETVRQAWISAFQLNPDTVAVIYNGGPGPDSRRCDVPERTRSSARANLNISAQTKIVLGCGTVYARKGTDLFAQIAVKTLRRLKGEEVVFVWAGELYDDRMAQWCRSDMATAGFEGKLIFTGKLANPRDLFDAADVFLLPSREDPLPLVVMEAMAAGAPVVCFERAGGAPELVGDNAGAVVPYLDVEEASAAVHGLLLDDQARAACGTAGRAAMERFTWDNHFRAFSEVIERAESRRSSSDVTAIVPLYNSRKYLVDRIESLLSQSLQPAAIVVLDDDSQDGSLEFARRLLEGCSIPTTFVANETNSGSPFRQWAKGLKLAATSLVWIAEADDVALPRFLERIVPLFDDETVVLAYAQSRPIREDGQPISEDYRGYLSDLSTEKWLSSYTSEGEEELKFLARKNTIPNASAVIVRREEALRQIGTSENLRLSGDWLFYARMARRGKIAFEASVLNLHRRHGDTVTEKAEKSLTWLEDRLAVHACFAAFPSVSTATRLEALCRTAFAYNVRRSRHANAGLPSFTGHPALREHGPGLLDSVTSGRAQGSLRLLMALPDANLGGGQVNCVRLANRLAEEHLVFLVNARPKLSEPELVAMVSGKVLLLEGSLSSLPWYETGGADSPRLRAETLQALVAFYGISHVFSQVWWADKFVFTHLTRDNPDLAWLSRMCGCYEYLMYNPKGDEGFSSLVDPLMRRVDALTYVADKNLELFEATAVARPPRIEKVFNGLPRSLLNGAADVRLALAEDERAVCLCSRAIAEKGWREAAAAVRAVNALPGRERGGKRLRLVLIGDGPVYDELQAEGREDILLLGRQANPVGVMKQCHFGLLPSRFRSESLPTVVIEYLACGLPVIATRIGSTPEMLLADDNRAAGWLLSAMEGEALVEEMKAALSALMADDELYDRSSAMARDLFSQRFDLEITAGRYVRMLQELKPETLVVRDSAPTPRQVESLVA